MSTMNHRLLFDTTGLTQDTLKVAMGLLREVVGPLEVSAAVIDDEDGGAAIEDLIRNVKRLVEQFDRATIAPPPPTDLDAAGNPKLDLTLLERQGVETMNAIKAWLDSDRKTPFPQDARMGVDAYLMLAAMRRKGVQ